MNPSHPEQPTDRAGSHAKRWVRWGPGLAVAAAGILVYLNSLPNGFAFDDLPIIVDNPTVQNPGNLGAIWLTPYWPGLDGLERGLYRPLTSFLFAIEWAMGGGGPLVFHLTSVLLHSLASVLVFALLAALVGRIPALCGALVFAVHPVHVEAVANSVGQAELLSAVCVLSATVAYARRPSGRGPSFRLNLLLSAAFLGGLLAKENAIVLPGLLLALDVAQGRVRRSGYADGALRLGVLFLAAGSVYLAVRFAVLGGSLTGDAAVNLPFLLDPGTRIRTALSVWPEYARLLLAPAHLSAMYDPATITPAMAITPGVLAGAALLLAAIVVCLLPSAWPGVALGSAWFVLAVLPVSNLVFPIGTMLAERTLYLPSVALAIWIAFAVLRVRARAPDPSWAPAAVLVAVAFATAALGTRTILRNPAWADNETLFATTLRDHPESFRVQWFTAQRLFEAGDTAGSRAHWERAVGIYGGGGGLLTSYARFLLATGEIGEAGEMATRALDIDPDGAWSLFTMGLVDLAAARPGAAASRADRLESLGFHRLARSLEDSIAAGGSDPR